MYSVELNSIDKIFQGSGFINIVVNEAIKRENFDEYRTKLYTKIVYGVVENKLYLDYQLSFYLKNPNIPYDIRNILRMGAYMLYRLRLKQYHVVSSLVEMVKNINPTYTTMTNAILRNLTRNEEKKVPKDDKVFYLSTRYSYDKKLVTYLMKQYPNDIEDILKPVKYNYNIYRINFLKTDLKEIQKELKDIKYEIKDHALITLENLTNSHLFKTGKLIYQDYASQKVAIVADPKPGMKILDMCSAPGSKSFHLATILKNDCQITSCDIYEHKAKLINDMASKLGVTCIKTVVCDSSLHNHDELFDLVLVDAPCTGMGVMKHKVDMKYGFDFGKIKEITNLQKALLGKAIKHLKDDGTLVYSTCTINTEENEDMMKYFIKKHKEFEIIEEHKYLPTDVHDGFYICKLRRKS